MTRETLGALSVAFDRPHRWRQAERDLLTAFAALTAQALDRITAREAERSAQRAERAANTVAAQFSETMQRSLLTWSPPREHLQVDVRYVPASTASQVGGDWYDAFSTADGTLTLVIGDVTGHDQVAAAAMAQLRNLTRGIAHSSNAGPAAVLTALDRAVADLHVDVLATLIVAQIHPADQEELGPSTAATPAAGAASAGAAGTGPDSGIRGGAQRWRMRWSNAGHPPPLLIGAEGGSTFLNAESDLLVGVLTDTVRHDHDVVLQAGSSVLFYTDGLVERRGQHLQQGLGWLAGAVAGLASIHRGREAGQAELADLANLASAVGSATRNGGEDPAEVHPDEAAALMGVDGPAVCDGLLELIGQDVEDDVALLLLHARPLHDPVGPLTEKNVEP